MRGLILRPRDLPYRFCGPEDLAFKWVEHWVSGLGAVEARKLSLVSPSTFQH